MWGQYAGSSGKAAPGAIQAPRSSEKGWHPTVLYMIGLVLVEMFVLGFISYHLLK